MTHHLPVPTEIDPDAWEGRVREETRNSGDWIRVMWATRIATSSPGPSPLSRWRVGAQKKTLANSRSRDLKISQSRARRHFETIKIPNIFGDTWPAVRQGLFRRHFERREDSGDEVTKSLMRREIYIFTFPLLPQRSLHNSCIFVFTTYRMAWNFRGSLISPIVNFLRFAGTNFHNTRLQYMMVVVFNITSPRWRKIPAMNLN